jgi:pentatricopeptide repeat protein
VEPPYIKYCLNRENWEKAREMFNRLLVKDKNQEYDECKKEFQGNRENH